MDLSSQPRHSFARIPHFAFWQFPVTLKGFEIGYSYSQRLKYEIPHIFAALSMLQLALGLDAHCTDRGAGGDS
jgi:hypothetical protein